MNNLYTWKNIVPAKFFALATIVSLILSAFPAFVLNAEAVVTPPGHDKVNICHWSQDDQEFTLLNVPKTSIGTAHGSAGSNDGDIIPAFDNYPGQNLTTDYSGNTGAQLLAAGCVMGSISGTKYNDEDNDSSIDGDTGIEDWTIRLYKVDTPWVLAASDVTDSDGEYEFTGLLKGDYKVCEVMKDNWTQTFVSNGSTNESPNVSEEGPQCRTVKIDTYGETNTVNFGNHYEEPVDYCDPSQKPGGKSIAQWHEENQFDGSSCFEYEVVQECGSLDVQFTTNETGLSYAFNYVIGTETPELANYAGDGTMPVSFDEDENGGSVDVTYYVVGAEKDYFVGSSVPNIWDGNGTTVTVDTDCEDEARVCKIGDNLLTNGSFEEPEVTNTSLWQKMASVAGWVIGKVSDDSSTTLELMRGWSGNEAADGEQYAELDGDHSTKVSQTVSLTEGATYELSWAFAPRHNIAAEQNQLAVLVDGSVVATEGPATGAAGLESGDWTRNSYEFVAGADDTEITFSDAGPSNSFGTFLDDAVLCLVKEPETCEPERHVFADGVKDYDQGLTKSGDDIAANRSNPEDATGTPDWTPGGSTGFYSLGFGGWIILSFDRYVVNVDGDDISVHEATNGTYPLEKVKVEVSQDGSTWYELSEEATNDKDEGGDGVTLLDFDETGLAWIKHVKLTDTTDPVLHGGSADGFDLDTVDATYVVCDEPEPEPEPKRCTLTISSDDTNTVVEKDGAFAKVLDFVHANWVKSLPVAEWIWGDQGPVDPTTDETQTFVNKFGINPAITITGAELKIASDNQFDANLNGTFLLDDDDLNNFAALQTYDVTSDVLLGNNKFVTAVTNIGVNNSNPESNPAGLYYELVITGEGAEDCGAPYEPEPEPEDPYCGDGEVNQEWEMCEPGEEGCTDYCTWDNQCTDLKLAMIDFTEAPESVSFDKSIILGAEGKTTPEGVWFNLEDVENGDAHDLATDNEGLVLTNDGSTLTFAVWGGNAKKKFDYVNADIYFKGLALGSVNDTNAVFNWPLEDGDYEDIFDKDGDEKITMEWYLTTGGDAASVAYTMGEPYDCEDCYAAVEARVVLQEGEDIFNNGDGNLNPVVILGDGTQVDFGEWFPVSLTTSGPVPAWIDDVDTVTNYDDPEEQAGLFVSREGNGEVKVALYGFHNPGGDTNYESLRATIEFSDASVINVQEIPGNFKLENHSETDGVNSNDNFDSFNQNSDSVDFDFWVDTAADGITITLGDVDYCEDDDDPEDELYLIDGHKFEAGDDYYAFTSGWEIELYDEDGFVAGTTTDEEGYYYFWVPAGEYEVVEVMQDGWYQVGIEDGGDYEYTEDEPETCEFSLPHENDDLPVFNSIAIILNDIEFNYSDYRCDFYNARQVLRVIDGYKYREGTETGIPGWTIELRDDEGEFISATTTDGDGYYYFEVPAGEYEVHEVMPGGWFQTGAYAYGGYATEDQDVNYCMFEIGDYQVFRRSLAYESEYQYEGYACNFINQEIEDEEEERSSYSSGTRTGGRGPAPQVAGASTMCPFLEDYMQIGWDNNPIEVMKLQMFLNMFKDWFGGTANPVTGVFGSITDSNVKAFQEFYHDDILNPWFNQGIVPHHEPTGFVYKTTRWKINDIICPGFEPFPSFEGENLNENVDLDLNESREG